MNSPSGATPACCSRWLASVWAASAGAPVTCFRGDLGLEEVVRERPGDLGCRSLGRLALLDGSRDQLTLL